MPRRDLPHELWTQIFQLLLPVPRENIEHTISNEVYYSTQKRPDLASALRVCRAWFLIAGAVMYSQVEVYDLAAFLLGFDHFSLSTAPGILPTPSSDAAYDLAALANGNTKLPLLRHTKHLQLVPYKWRPGEGEYWRETRMQFWTILGDEALLVGEKKYSALKALIRLDVSAAMPQLVSLQLGVQGDCDDTPDQILHGTQLHIGPLLLRQLPPRFVCQSTKASSFHLLPLEANDWVDRILPEVFCAHACIKTPIIFMWGTRNLIFAGNDYCSADETGQHISMSVRAKWAFKTIKASIPPWHKPFQALLYPNDINREIDLATTFTFCALARSQSMVFKSDVRENAADTDRDENSNADEQETPVLSDDELDKLFREAVGLERAEADKEEAELTGQLEKDIREQCQRELWGSTEFWAKTLKLVTKKDMPPCPSCGLAFA